MCFPDLPSPAFQNLLHAFDQEFTYTLGCCTIIRRLDGRYLSRQGLPDPSQRFISNLPWSLREQYVAQNSLSVASAW